MRALGGNRERGRSTLVQSLQHQPVTVATRARFGGTPELRLRCQPVFQGAAMWAARGFPYLIRPQGNFVR